MRCFDSYDDLIVITLFMKSRYSLNNIFIFTQIARYSETSDLEVILLFRTNSKDIEEVDFISLQSKNKF